jgi:hypothetical protein
MRHIFFRGLLYISNAFKLYYLVPNPRLISLKLKFLLLKPKHPYVRAGVKV